MYGVPEIHLKLDTHNKINSAKKDNNSNNNARTYKKTNSILYKEKECILYKDSKKPNP